MARPQCDVPLVFIWLVFRIGDLLSLYFVLIKQSWREEDESGIVGQASRGDCGESVEQTGLQLLPAYLALHLQEMEFTSQLQTFFSSSRSFLTTTTLLSSSSSSEEEVEAAASSAAFSDQIWHGRSFTHSSWNTSLKSPAEGVATSLFAFPASVFQGFQLAGFQLAAGGIGGRTVVLVVLFSSHNNRRRYRQKQQ